MAALFIQYLIRQSYHSISFAKMGEKTNNMKNNNAKIEFEDLLFQTEKNKAATNLSLQNKKQLMNTNQMVTPPSSVWDRIEKVLDEQNRSKLKTPKEKSQSTKQGKLVSEKQTFYMTSVA